VLSCCNDALHVVDNNAFRAILFPSNNKLFVTLNTKCPILTKFGFSRQIFKKVLTIKFHENLSNVSRVDKCGQTDGHNEANILGQHGGLYSSDSGQVLVAGTCDHGNEPSGSTRTKCGQFSPRISIPAPGPTQPPIPQYRDSPSGVKRPGSERDHSPSSAEVKNEGNYTSIPPTCLHNEDREKLYFHFILASGKSENSLNELGSPDLGKGPVQKAYVLRYR
jgi:hypothetical protein